MLSKHIWSAYVVFIIVLCRSFTKMTDAGRSDIITRTSSLMERKISNWTWPKISSGLKKLVDGIVVPNLKYFWQMQSTANLSSECQEAFFMAMMALRRDESWIIKMIDATAKIPSGILDGTVIDFGSFDECLSIHVTSKDQSVNNKQLFQGKYCMVGLHHPLFSPLEQNHDTTTYEQKYGIPPPWIADQMARAHGFMKKIALWLGVCVPSSCSHWDVRNAAQLVVGPLGFTASVADCHENEVRIWYSYEIIAISILGVLLVFVIAGTATDLASRLLIWHWSRKWTDMKQTLPLRNNWVLQTLQAFSLVGNTEQLLHISGSGSSTLGFLQGIRFLSATWIILGHTYFYVDTWMFLKYRHLLGVTELFDRKLPAAVIENFTIPVGSFFFISGFLMTYTNWTKLQKSEGKINLLLFFFHKYWRMTPALGLAIALFMALPLLGSGPLWDSTLKPEINLCISNWYKNLLYISNFWEADNLCLIHTWYLAALMQFHVVGVIILLLLFRWPVYATVMGFFLLIAGSTWTVLQVVWKDFPMPAPGLVRDLDVIKEYNSDVYIKPYTHIASYLMGMATGLTVIKYRHVKLSIVQNSLLWTLAVCTGSIAVYGIYIPSEGLLTRAVYISLHRVAWAIAVGWLTFSCASKTAGPVNRLLSWSVFQLLGQLSYLAYLLHPLVILYRNGSLRERAYFSHSELVLSFLSNVMLGFFLAFLGYVAVERPFSAVEANLLSWCNSSRKKSAISTLLKGSPQDSQSDITIVNA